MTKLWRAATVAVALMLAGCGPTIDPNERPQFTRGSNTITFLVYDAVTGAGVENATVTFTVGTYDLPVSKHSGNAYIVAQVPQGTHLATFAADGYVAALGQPQGTSNTTLSDPSSQTFITYQVVLYPIGGVNDDLVVKAFESDKGAPVASGRVVATLTTATSPVGITFPNPLPVTLTVKPSTVIAEIGEGGSATLAKDKMVLGGNYSIDLFGARNAAGAYLSPVEDRPFVAGKDFPQLTIFMGPPTQTPVALNANNETVAVYPNLQVNFPYPIELCSLTTAHTWVKTAGIDGNADGTTAAPAAMSPVTAAVSADGGRLTLTANFGTGTAQFQPADGLLEVRFDNIQVRVKGSATCTNLNVVKLRGGSNVSTGLRMAAAL
ncbi:MAG: hypothetical protein ACT4TC_15275 [Myxococcaceae bacterium]